MTEGHEALRELVAPYVVDAVSPAEAERVRAHLAGCAECTSAAGRYSAALTTLAASIAPEPLPDGFVDAVVARALGAAPAPQPAPAAARPQPRGWGHALAYAALALAVALLAGGVVAARRDAAQQRLLVRALLREQGIALSGPAGAVARLVSTSNGGLFVAEGLPRPAPGKTYQLWILGGRRPVSAGTFETSEGLAVVATSRSPSGAEAAAVTIEPDGGSDRPTTDPIMTSS
jgi:anti-sigma-K factor RskA